MVKRFFAEPFIQFLILGGLLFIFVSYVQKRNDLESREIKVDTNRIALIIQNYKTETGTVPTKQQLDWMINNYIKEEISYREAKKMGLDKDDEMIRRRLMQKFDFVQADLVDVAPPSEEDLKKFYTQHPEMFKKVATVSFSHIYFSAENSSDEIAKQRALHILQILKTSGLQRAPDKGDHFPLQFDYTEQSLLDIKQNFGDKPISDELFKGPLKTWIGPVQSGYGWHLLFITNRDNATAIPFTDIKNDVKVKYMEMAKETQNKKQFDKISENYIINRAYLNVK